MIDTCPYPQPTIKTVESLPAALYFAWEREVVRIVKERGLEKPWTKDPVLTKYKFTNIHRRDDRVSRWLIDNVIRHSETRRDLWFILLICRLINWPPTLSRLISDGILFRDMEDFDIKDFSDSIEGFKAEGKKVYSGAYMVYPTKMDVGGVKSASIARHILVPVIERAGFIENQIFTGRSVEGVVTEMSKSFGLSTFMSGQVAADLTYSMQLGSAVDLYTFAPIGPGSSRGLNYLHKRKPFASWKQPEFNKALMRVRNAIVEKLEIEDLTLHDVQNIMCEYSKYAKAVLGEGNPKTTYQPEEEF